MKSRRLTLENEMVVCFDTEDGFCESEGPNFWGYTKPEKTQDILGHFGSNLVLTETATIKVHKVLIHTEVDGFSVIDRKLTGDPKSLKTAKLLWESLEQTKP